MLCNILTCGMESGDAKLQGMNFFIFVACFSQSTQLGSLHEADLMLKLVAGASQSRVEVALP